MLVLILLGINAGAAEDFRTFTSTDGRTLEAKLIKMAGDKVVIEAKNGTNFTVAATSFSPEDQVAFKKFAEAQAKLYDPRLEVKFASGKGDRRTDVYFDERTQELVPGVTIENREQTFTMTNAAVTVMTFGKHVTTRDELKVISKEEFKVTLAPGKTADWTGKKIKLEYDDRSSFRYGHRYAGYLIVVKNDSGRIIEIAGTTGFTKKAEAALKLKADQLIDRDLKPFED
ncbi:MAG: hypothetical protein ACI8UO_003079 [Verrucomicrobiales bacterium]|jgi:hypothetical protein